jgi:hypothetical protein
MTIENPKNTATNCGNIYDSYETFLPPNAFGNQMGRPHFTPGNWSKLFCASSRDNFWNSLLYGFWLHESAVFVCLWYYHYETEMVRTTARLVQTAKFSQSNLCFTMKLIRLRIYWWSLTVLYSLACCWLYIFMCVVYGTKEWHLSLSSMDVVKGD